MQTSINVSTRDVNIGFLTNRLSVLENGFKSIIIGFTDLHKNIALFKVNDFI